MEFAWTFPCYILASKYNVNPENGTVLLDGGLGFIAPIYAEGACIAIFTDLDLARNYRERTGLPRTVVPIAIPGPVCLLEFLTRASRNFQRAIVDVNPRTKRGVPLQVSSMIAILQQNQRK